MHACVRDCGVCMGYNAEAGGREGWLMLRACWGVGRSSRSAAGLPPARRQGGWPNTTAGRLEQTCAGAAVGPCRAGGQQRVAGVPAGVRGAGALPLCHSRAGDGRGGLGAVLGLPPALLGRRGQVRVGLRALRPAAPPTPGSTLHLYAHLAAACTLPCLLRHCAPCRLQLTGAIARSLPVLNTHAGAYKRKRGRESPCPAAGMPRWSSSTRGGQSWWRSAMSCRAGCSMRSR